jgi:hypothetical protein
MRRDNHDFWVAVLGPLLAFAGIAALFGLAWIAAAFEALFRGIAWVVAVWLALLGLI